MGGEREFKTGTGAVGGTDTLHMKEMVAVETAPPKKKGKKKGKAAKVRQNVRIHEKEGFVHFHVDAENLKVAVPVDTWYAAWQKLSAEPGRWSHVDPEQKTVVIVTTKVKNNSLDARVKVRSIETSTLFVQLQEFTHGS